MLHKQTIAIIGADEKIGAAITKVLSRGNYRLLLLAKDQGKLQELKSQLNGPATIAEIELGECAREVSWEADIIIVATPYEEEMKIAERIREVAVGKVVVSTLNPPTHNYDTIFHNTSAAEELQKLLPYSKVVKTFSTSFAHGLITPIIDDKTKDTFIAGNNGDSIEVVSKLVRAVGFNPVVVGDLTVSRKLETLQLY